MAESAKIVAQGEQVFCPKTERVISKLYGLTCMGEIDVVATTVVSVEDFMFWYGLQTRTLEAIKRHNAERLIAALPKGRKSKVVRLRSEG